MTQEEFAKRYSFSVRDDKIGGGSFGTVYRAYDNVRDRYVAIKVSETKMHGEKEFSLTQEFAAIKDLSEHSNLAFYEKVYSFETFQGVFDYAIMQFYSDGNLSEYLKNNTLTNSGKEQLIFQILEGIGHLHQNGVVHRDLKPSNILVVDRNGTIIPKITDFGLSKKAAQKGAQFTNSFAGGTLQYSSPEQLKGKPLKFNTDLWSFGCIAYEVLMGSPLFESDNATASAEAEKQLIENILKGNHSEKLQSIPMAWKNTLKFCLALDPRERVSNISEIKELFYGKEDGSVSNNLDERTIVKHNQQNSIDDAGTKVFQSNKVESSHKITQNETKKTPKKTKKRLFALPIATILIVLLSTAGYFGWAYYQETKKEKAWELAQSSHSREAYSQYVSTYPNGKNSDIAKDNIAWLNTTNDHSKNAYQKYQSEKPEGLFAKNAIDSLKKLTWEYSINRYPGYKKSDWGDYVGNNRNPPNIFQLTNDQTVLTRSIKKNNDYNLEIIKLDTDGSELWSKIIPGTKNEMLIAIAETKDGGFVGLGSKYAKMNVLYPYIDAWIFKISKTGNLLWEKVISKDKFNHLRDIAIDSLEQIVLVGSFGKYHSSKNKAFSMVLNNNGDITNEVIQSNGEYLMYDFKKITPFNDTTFIVWGWQGDNIGKMDNSGKIIWSFNLHTNFPEYKIITTESISIENEKLIHVRGRLKSDGWVDKELYFFELVLDNIGKIVSNKIFTKTSNLRDHENGIYINPTRLENHILIQKNIYEKKKAGNVDYSNLKSGSIALTDHQNKQYWELDLNPTIVDQTSSGNLILTDQTTVGRYYNAKSKRLLILNIEGKIINEEIINDIIEVNILNNDAVFVTKETDDKYIIQKRDRLGKL